MQNFIRSPEATAIGLSHVVLLGDHGNAGATNEIKQGGSIFRCFRCIMPSYTYVWPHIMCYCPNFLERDNQTLVDNAGACNTSPLKGTAHTLRFHGQNGSCDIIPCHNPEMLLKSPAPLHDNIHLAVLFVTLLVVTIHRHHPELHQQPQFDAWLQRNNITNEVRKVMQKVAVKCRQMSIVPVSPSLFSAAAAAAAAAAASAASAAAAASPAVAASSSSSSAAAAAAAAAFYMLTRQLRCCRHKPDLRMRKNLLEIRLSCASSRATFSNAFRLHHASSFGSWHSGP